ncbi:MAG: diadenylate cyclase [Firmicutes bacterium]|nr:diadenylate cyclase [Bacillota bacterium]
MRITKATYPQFRKLFDSLKHFLVSLKYDRLDFRMIVAECILRGDSKTLMVFDSHKSNIEKVAQNIIKHCDSKSVLKLFGLPTDTTNIEFFLPEGAVENGKGEPKNVKGAKAGKSGGGDDSDVKGQKEQVKTQISYYVAFSFKEKVTSLLADFLSRYQHEMLTIFSSRTTTLFDVIDRVEQTFADAVKQYVDLDIVQTLAGASYERRDAVGSIIYVRTRSEANYKLRFEKEIDFNFDNLRLIRKLLEMSDSRVSLVVFNKKIIGLGTKGSVYRKVQFTGNQKWTLYLSSKESLRFSRGKFFFDRGNNQDILDLPKGFILKKFEKAFINIVNVLKRQKNGALLIISDEAKQEVARLTGLARGYAVSPVDLNIPENLSLIKYLANVDGAVFIDRQLKCYGTGIILDGIAKTPGSNARGARFNSACCYLDNRTKVPVASIIFSEDETMDILANDFSKQVNLSVYKPIVQPVDAKGKKVKQDKKVLKTTIDILPIEKDSKVRAN